MKSVKYPALATFRMLKFPRSKDNAVDSPSEEKRKLSLEKFSQVIQMHAKTHALFRLHGAVLEHWKSPESKKAEAKGNRKNQPSAKRTAAGAL
eukprot:CAMPEP_0170193146 /NCGR_PEP_ID=MMETSP0040_2-20121228/56222_1 /TAXON_ID=641309 /ORGANISM="Lotharella oceanica, Strain CCMP622" /LENGTH=92 /DNA_ID=CAMNT_0010441707 /DNA_START=30 /DNA_END=305 /DNA_ORIENTATION=+